MREIYRPHGVSQGTVAVERFLQGHATGFVDTDQRLLVFLYDKVGDMLIRAPVFDVRVVGDNGGDATCNSASITFIARQFIICNQGAT